MKTLLVIPVAIFLILIGIVTGALAKDFDFTIKGTYFIYQDKDLTTDGKGIKAELQYKYLYLWGSREQTELRLTGQRAGDISLYGVGLGGKVELVKRLSAFVEVGYYIPYSALQKSTQTYAEGVYYKWYRCVSELGQAQYAGVFTKYTYELKSNFGGSAGLVFNQELYKGLSLNISGAYRFLNLPENWDAASPKDPNYYIQTKEKRSFSGGQFGIGLNYKF